MDSHLAEVVSHPRAVEGLILFRHGLAAASDVLDVLGGLLSRSAAPRFFPVDLLLFLLLLRGPMDLFLLLLFIRGSLDLFLFLLRFRGPLHERRGLKERLMMFGAE